MIKKILTRLILKWYVDKNRDIHSLSPRDEIRKYLFKTPLDVEELLKSEITSRTVRYYEAKSDIERAMIKGEVFALKLFKDRHLTAMNIENDNDLKDDDELKIKYWKKLKSKN